MVNLRPESFLLVAESRRRTPKTIWFDKKKIKKKENNHFADCDHFIFLTDLRRQDTKWRRSDFKIYVTFNVSSFFSG